jgi:hypothetical protein
MVTHPNLVGWVKCSCGYAKLENKILTHEEIQELRKKHLIKKSDGE